MARLPDEINEGDHAIRAQDCGTLHGSVEPRAHIQGHGATVIVGREVGVHRPMISDLVIDSCGTLAVSTAQSTETTSAAGPAPDYPVEDRPSRLKSSARGNSTWAYLRQRNAWIQAELTRTQDESSAAILDEEQPDTVEALCHVCASRGGFTICPQVLSTKTNPQIHIEDTIEAALYANQVASPTWRPLERRMVMYTDAAAINDVKNGPCVAGAAVSYQLILAGSVSPWVGVSYSIIGTNDSTKVELYAIGSALDLAAREIQTMGAEQKALLPSVVVLSDSKSSLYYLHDYIWQNSTPRILSSTDFARYLSRPLSQLRDLGVWVEFHWVPGHAMIEGNCRADTAAGLASRYTISRYPEALYKKLPSCHVFRINEDTRISANHTRDLVYRYSHLDPQRRSLISYAYESQAQRIRALQSGLTPSPETQSFSRPQYDETL
jgi:ribonuclease HI